MAASTRFASQKRIALAGSEKSALTAKAQPAAKTAAARGNIIVSVVLKCKAALPVKGGVPQERLTRAAYASKYGADPESKKLVKAFAKEFGLKVVSGLPPGPCTLQLTGSVAAMQKAFGVTLQQQGDLRLRSGSIYLPAELEGHVNAVLGLDNRPQAKPHFRPAKAAAGTSYTPVQVAQLYQFPAGASAKGQTIGLIELGGGFRAADITAYFKTLGQTAPTVTAVSVARIARVRVTRLEHSPVPPSPRGSARPRPARIPSCRWSDYPRTAPDRSPRASGCGRRGVRGDIGGGSRGDGR